MHNWQDNAIQNAFSENYQGQVNRGDRGKQVVAIQYALGRLGHLSDLCDGRFGPITEAAVSAFQQAVQVSVTGQVDVETLKLLDKTVRESDFRVPAIRSGDPIAYLSDFVARGLPFASLDGAERNLSWDHQAVQAAYGRFVADYWPVMKANQVEGDCKNIALFFMDQFRKKLKQDLFVDLPHPLVGRREKNWIVATAEKTRGLFDHQDNLSSARVGRYDYDAVRNIQSLDPDHSMIFGVNVHYPETTAHQVARSAKRLFNWDRVYDNRGDLSRPEIPVNSLKPGHMIFIDHTGNGTYDHTVNVIEVQRDDRNRVRRLVLAMGSFDDVRDNSAATIVIFDTLNPYSEEVVVELDSKGDIVDSRVTYGSEPPYLVRPRYSAATTLMERQRGGRLIVGRWG